MISINSFIDKYARKTVAVPWGYAGECVSLIQRYLHEVYGQVLKRRGNAIVYGETLLRDKVAYKVTNPKYGDIIVWGKPFGLIDGRYYGHVAIYMDKSYMFDQNNYSVLPTRTSQVRPMPTAKPLYYLRMNQIPITDKPKYENEVYAFKSTTTKNINVRADHNVRSKILRQLKTGEVFNYNQKFVGANYLWVTNGKEWVAVREMKNGVRKQLWGTLQAQTGQKTQPVVKLNKHGQNIKVNDRIQFSRMYTNAALTQGGAPPSRLYYRENRDKTVVGYGYVKKITQKGYEVVGRVGGSVIGYVNYVNVY